MLKVTPEGGLLSWGFNFYPWAERKTSIGFRFWTPNKSWRVRYAPHIKKLYIMTAVF